MAGSGAENMRFATVYILFAAAFAIVNLYTLNVPATSEMFDTVAEAMRLHPFSTRPEKTLEDIQSQNDLKEWISNVFIVSLYREQPSEGLKHIVLARRHASWIAVIAARMIIFVKGI